jgi:hypothetical protein
MSKLKERIEEINRTVKKSRRINNVLWIVVGILVGVSVYFGITAEIQKNNAKEQARISDSLKIVADTLAFEAELAKAQIKEKEEMKAKMLDSLLRDKYQNAWESTKKINTLDAYAQYFQQYPDSVQKIQEAVETLFNEDGYVQIKDSKGPSFFTKITTKVPVKNLYKAKSSRSVRNGIIGQSPNSSRNGDVILEDQIVQYDTVIKSGTAEWARIRYSNN